MEPQEIKVLYKGKIRKGVIKQYSIYSGGFGVELKDGHMVHPNDVELISEENNSLIDTIKHKIRIKQLIELFVQKLEHCSLIHDNSKLSEEEKPYFDNATKLRDLTYGSPEYKEALKNLKPALDHHYKNNSHHPEHFLNGINNMDLFDVVEMFFDWKAASERHGDGDIYKSIQYNHKRYQMSNQLTSIFENTAKNFNWTK